MSSFVGDLFDGMAARKFKQESSFGGLLDMVTDRCSTTGLLYILSTEYKPPLCCLVRQNRSFKAFSLLFYFCFLWLSRFPKYPPIILTSIVSHLKFLLFNNRLPWVDCHTVAFSIPDIAWYFFTLVPDVCGNRIANSPQVWWGKRRQVFPCAMVLSLLLFFWLLLCRRRVYVHHALCNRAGRRWKNDSFLWENSIFVCSCLCN